MNIRDLKVGDGVIVKPFLKTRAVVVATDPTGCYGYAGIKVDLLGHYQGLRRWFVVGLEFERDPQGAWNELRTFNCTNRNCWFHKEYGITALDYCPNCGTPLEVK